MSNTIVEIRAAEGGDDAKLLVKDLATVYQKFCSRKGIKVISSNLYDGCMIMTISGKESFEIFKHEIGGHRWQRVPPTEKKDRVHTSTVTVAVFEESQRKLQKINKDDVTETFMRGSGKGGQHRNKTSTACRLTHNPTGIQVRVESERSQLQNRTKAWEELTKRIQAVYDKNDYTTASNDRKLQVGSGMRGDKIRTYRERDDLVIDHNTNKKVSYERVLKGELELLW